MFSSRVRRVGFGCPEQAGIFGQTWDFYPHLAPAYGVGGGS